MIDENNELTNEANGTHEQTERTPGERAAIAERVRLHRARKAKQEARQLVLSESQAIKQRQVTESLFARTFARLTREQKLALEAESEDHLTLKYMNAMLYDTVALCDLEHFEHCRPDLVAEIYSDFIKAFPFAKEIVFPRAWYADKDFRKEEYGNHFFDIRSPDGEILVEFDPEASPQFSLDRFFDVVKAYKKWRERTSPIVEEKQKRGRSRKTAADKPEVVVDPAVVKSWSTPPDKPQLEHWDEVGKVRVGLAIEKDQAEATPTMPVVFPQ